MSPIRQSESRLVRRAAKGDEAAFAEIFERHSQELYRYCRAILGDPDEAQDALQNTMDRVLRALPGEERTIYLRPWLFRIARNESLTLIRKRPETVELTDASAPALPAADIRAEHREEVRTLVEDLASLPESQRSALVLHELSGLSHDEVAQALQRSPRASRQAVYEARLALQDLKEGRDMECDEIRAAISDGDGRVIRGRKIRAHLRDCRRCSDFALAIEQRHPQLEMLAPPLPAAAAAGLIASALGGGGAAGGLAGAGAATAGVIGGSAVFKSVGIVAATLALGVGGASVAGVDLPGGGGSGKSAAPAAEASKAGGSPPGRETAATASETKVDRGEDSRSRGAQQRNEKANDNARGPKDKKDKENQGNSNGPPAHSNAGGNAGGTTGPPGHSNAGGNSGGTTGPPEHSNAGGNSGGTTTGPPEHSNAGGNSGGTTGPPEHSNAGGNSDKDK